MKYFLSFCFFILAATAQASLIIKMKSVTNDGAGYDIGYVKADDTIYGLLLTPKLKGLSPGIHGFHVHVEPMCSNRGMDAGGHLDPLKINLHNGPYAGNSHLGDLPVLIVNMQGEANLPVLAPRLKLSDIRNHALMIHAGGDNYSDHPEKLGGGGERFACGVIPFH